MVKWANRPLLFFCGVTLFEVIDRERLKSALSRHGQDRPYDHASAQWRFVGAEARAWGWANVVRGTLPLMERLGVATGADLQPDTLAERLLN